MNEYSMDPVVLEKLERFSRRRRFLILLRGACGTVAVWFTAMMLLALVDRFIIMPDPLRLALSIAGYAAAGVVFWLTCGRQMAKIPDTRELAKLIELAAPKLREELLSAVELADDSTEHQWDSEVFRAAVQKITASHVENIQIDSILSRKLISYNRRQRTNHHPGPVPGGDQQERVRWGHDLRDGRMPVCLYAQ